MDYLRDLIVIFALSVGIVVIFARLRLPAIVGFLFAGALAGPNGFGVVQGLEQVRVLAELGVALLLFTIGLELSLAHLNRLRRLLLGGGGAQVLLTTLLVFLIGAGFGLIWQQAVFFGMLVALSSTAIVLKLLAERGEVDSLRGQTALAILIFQDLCIVPMTLLTPFLAGREFHPAELLFAVGMALIVVGMAIVASRLAVPWVLSQVVATRNREIFLMTIILLCMGTAWVTAEAGLSLALGAFLAGLVVSESEYSHQALGEILPLRNAFNGIFFVSVGMLFSIQTFLNSPVGMGLGVIGLVVAKAGVVLGVLVALGYSIRLALTVGLGLAQVGEFSFVLAMAGVASGVLSEALFQLFVGMAVLTMAATPMLWAVGTALGHRFAARLPAWSRSRDEESLEPAAEQKKDHVVIVGYGINGRNLARVMESVQIPYVIVEMNPETVRTERKRGVPIQYGDATTQEVLERVGVGRAWVLVLAISDPVGTRHATELARRLNPALHIIVRTRYVREMDPLFALGANQVVPEEFETSVEIFSRVLRAYLIPRDIVERSVREIRQDGYEMFRGLRDAHRPAEAVRDLLRGVVLEVFQAREGSPVEGRTLAEVDLRGKTGAMVLAIQKDSQVQANPPAETSFSVGVVALLLGTPDQLAKAAPLFSNPEAEVPALPEPDRG
ncbi:MAG: cation:proton antiporter [Terriglobia bacterium]